MQMETVGATAASTEADTAATDLLVEDSANYSCKSTEQGRI